MANKEKIFLAAYQSAFNGLTFRLLALITLVLFPLGIISVYQTDKLLKETERLQRAALLAETTSAARDERELILQTLGAAEGLTATLNFTNTGQCQRAMKSYVESSPASVFAGFINIDGVMTCGSTGGQIDFADTDEFQNALSAPGSTVEVVPTGAVSGKPVLIISQPVWRDKDLIGFVSISVPLRLADALNRSSEADDGLRIVTFDKDGAVITATDGRSNAENLLPANVSLEDIRNSVGQTFQAKAQDGTPHIFAVVAVFEDQVKVLGSRPAAAAAWGGLASQQLAALFFPFAIWSAGIAVAYFGLQRLVIRHVSALRSALRKFALGDRDALPLNLDNPPEEFAETQRAFNRMAVLITEAELRQTKDLEDKEVLLKEVHHRVKNNLQMIASIMNMQARKAESEEAHQMLVSLQRRVNGLAMLHRTLYTTPDLVTIEASDLLQAVVRDVVTTMVTPGIDIEYQLDDVSIYPDQAVPLSMLLAEAVTNALKYVVKPPNKDAWLRVFLKKSEDDHLKLSIVNSKGSPLTEASPKDAMSGLGTRLMKAFVLQLDAEMTIEDQEEVYALHIMFERQGFGTADG